MNGGDASLPAAALDEPILALHDLNVAYSEDGSATLTVMQRVPVFEAGKLAGSTRRPVAHYDASLATLASIAELLTRVAAEIFTASAEGALDIFRQRLLAALDEGERRGHARSGNAEEGARS
jgi:hypothetical protein